MGAVAALKLFRQTGSAYGQMQATRPQTIGYALADSPAGQASWIYDIFDSGSGRTGHPESVLPRDRRLEITMYWLTDTAGSSARFYFEEAHRLGKHNKRAGSTCRLRSASFQTTCRQRAAGGARVSKPLLLARGGSRRSLRADGSARSLYRRATSWLSTDPNHSQMNWSIQ